MHAIDKTNYQYEQCIGEARMAQARGSTLLSIVEAFIVKGMDNSAVHVRVQLTNICICHFM